MTGFIIKIKLSKKNFFRIFSPQIRGKNSENHGFKKKLKLLPHFKNSPKIEFKSNSDNQ
jgi:hypothetical protein